jgi:hypothetical protein
LRFLSASNKRSTITARVEIDVREGGQVRRREKTVLAVTTSKTWPGVRSTRIAVSAKSGRPVTTPS